MKDLFYTVDIQSYWVKVRNLVITISFSKHLYKSKYRYNGLDQLIIVLYIGGLESYFIICNLFSHCFFSSLIRTRVNIFTNSRLNAKKIKFLALFEVSVEARKCCLPYRFRKSKNHGVWNPQYIFRERPRNWKSEPIYLPEIYWTNFDMLFFSLSHSVKCDEKINFSKSLDAGLIIIQRKILKK